MAFDILDGGPGGTVEQLRLKSPWPIVKKTIDFRA
jgi:hypothetical protein